MTPRIDSIRLHVRRGTPPRKLKEGDEKYVKGVLMVRQQMYSFGRAMISNGRPVWEWVERGSERDRGQGRKWGRYRTLRNGTDVPAPPDGWKILESGRPVPAGYMVFVEGYRVADYTGWRQGEDFFGFEATYEGERRAFAVPQTKNEIMRAVFERVCVCIAEGKMRKQPVSVSANVAVKKYTARCKCGMGVTHAPE
jgi:hypothetical protein